MLRQCTVCSGLILVASMLGAAHAAPGNQGSDSAVQFVVHGTSGGYDVAISKQLVTVFYFPEKVKTAIVPNQRDLWIQITNDTVALQPLREPLATNLNVDTETLHISIVLKTAPVDQAKTQIVFVSAKAKEEEEKRFQAELDKRVGPVRAELDETKRALEAKIREQGRTLVGSGMARHFQARALSAVARSHDVVVRVDRAVVVGDDLFLHFAVQNRAEAPFHVARVQLLQGGTEIAQAAVDFVPAGARTSELGVVNADKTGSGVISVPLASVKRGSPLEIRLSEPGSGAALSITGVQIE